MLRLSGTTPDGQRVVILVLQPENVARMRDGDPVFIDIQRLAPDLITAPLYVRIEAPKNYEATVREYAAMGVEDGAKINIIPAPAKGEH